MILDLAVDLHRFDNEDLDMIQNHMIQKHDAEIYGAGVSHIVVLYGVQGAKCSLILNLKKKMNDTKDL